MKDVQMMKRNMFQYFMKTLLFEYG